MVTFAAVQASRSSADRAAELRFDNVTAQVVQRLDDEMLRYIDLLRGVGGLFAGSDAVTDEEFAQFVRALDLELRYPGARVVAIVHPTGADAAGGTATVTSAEPDPNEQLPPGTTADDVAMLAATLDRSADSGLPALSEFVDVDGTSHFFVTHPLTGGLVDGWATVWVDGEIFLDELRDADGHDLGITARSAVGASEAVPPPVTIAARPAEPPAVARDVAHGVVDQEWLLTVTSTERLTTAGERIQPWIALGTGAALTVAVALLVALQGRARARSNLLLDRARRSEDRSDRLLDIAPVAIIEVDGHGDVLRWNGAAADLFEVATRDAVGRPLETTVEHDGVTRRLLDLVADGCSPTDGARASVRQPSARGSERRDVVVLCAPVDERDGRRLIVIVDETEHARLLARLADAQKLDLVGRLAGGVAHDFNNFLAAIVGYVELVLGDDELDAEHRAALAQSVAASNRAAAVVSQLLAVSRHQVDRPQVVDVARHVTAPDSLLRTAATSDVTLTIEVEPSERALTVRIDPTQLEQVLLNLVINARQAIDGPGRIDVTVGGDAEFVTIEVRDDGHGMPPHVSDRVFEPFFSTKGPAGGTGLGLSTVHTIVTEAGGSIDLTTSDGHGSTFVVALPRVDEPASVPAAAAHPDRSPVVDRPTPVLLVEDEPAVRSLIARVLAAAGFDVIVAGDAETAFERVRSHHAAVADNSAPPLALVLTDVVLPGASGPDLVARLRTIGEQAPVVYMSGYAHGTLSDGGELPPGTRYIGKPFSAEELRRVVRDVVAERPA